MDSQTGRAGTSSRAVACIQRLRDAINHHDLEAMTNCFDPDYQSTFPAHPDRAFHGHAQMRKNWSQIFAAVPDIQANLLSCTADGEVVWSEWDWQGTRADGAPFMHRGVTIQGVPEDHIVWVRLYMEPVQESGPGVDVAMQPGVGAR